MDQDRINGIAHQIKGSMKAAVGTLIGDAKLNADGIAEQEAGKALGEAAAARDPGTHIDPDRIAGVAHQFTGAVKEEVGVIIGDAEIEANGAAERAAGKLQNAKGSARDMAKDRPAIM